MPQPVVLIVDDDRAIINLLQLVLSDEGFEVDSAYDGVEALERVSERTPDAIVLDLNMPVMDGPTFYRELRALPDPRARAVPVVIVSAVRSAQAKRELGAEASVSKPFDEDELIALIRGVLATA